MTTLRQTLSRGVLAAAAATGILSLTSAPALADSIAVGATEDSSGVLAGNNVQVPIEVPLNVCGNTVNAVAALNPAHDNSCGNSSQGSHSSASSSASAGSHAGGSQAVASSEDSYGVLTGNNVQAPISAPVNVCGNTVNAVAALNPAYDNSCGNTSQGGRSSSYGTSSTSGSEAVASSEDSYGVLTGNNVQAPISLPLNVCGNGVNVVAALNDTYGNSCGNEGPGYGTEEETPAPPSSETPPATSTPTTPASPPTRVVHTPPSVGVEVPEDTPQLAETGSEGMLFASVAGAALLSGGAVLYRRGRTAARR
ncbi:chaplin family protein [Streptomyces sp. AC627_RSS907]|uniref:chaplin family protein n=1 Tax=Streptomyces sp. AC627_RSS907 TaxID=2823684 RepID=UPI001C21067E|nr:chaplin family protein [Streptomyces sp. AC627_RSS907]